MNLRNFYSCLAFISTLAAIQSILLPRLPEASKISSDNLDRLKSSVITKGQVVTYSRIREGSSDYNVSHSPIIRLTITPNTDLILTNVQVRDRSNFSISYITDSVKSLKLNDSTSSIDQAPFFLSERNSAGKSFQTCLVPGNSLPANFGVNQIQLSTAVDQVQSSDKYLVIKRFLGLSPNRRYQCVLITLKTSLADKESYQLWRNLLNKLQPVFK